MTISTRLLIGLLSLSLAGCVRPLVGPTLPVSTTRGPVGSLYDTPLRVTVKAPPSLQALPVDWSRIRLQVDSAKLYEPLVQTVDTTGNQATVEFRVPPGPVTVQAHLLLSGTVVAVGSVEEVITPGVTKNLTITMTTAQTTVNTLAGKMTPFFGEGLPAVESWLEAPEAIAMDASGNLFVADAAERYIRRISGIAPHVNTTILGPDVLASAPNALAYDGAGNLYYTLSDSSTLYRVNVATKQVTAVRHDLWGTNGLVYHPDGYLFISDAANHKIWKVSATGDSFTEFLSYQNVNSAVGEAFQSPAGMALSLDGTVLYVADTEVHRVWSVVIATKLVEPFAGAGEWGFISPQESRPALEAPIGTPYGLAMSVSGELFISSNNANQVYRVSTGGILTVLAGVGEGEPSVDDGPAQSAVLAQPMGLCVNSVGDVFVADSGNHRIRRITGLANPLTSMISTFAGRSGSLNYNGGHASQGLPFNRAVFNDVQRVAVDEFGNVYVADTGNHRVRVLAKVSQARFGISLVAGHDYTVLGTDWPGWSSIGYPGYESAIQTPSGLAIDGQGNLYVADAEQGAILKLDKLTGIVSQLPTSGILRPEGMTFSGGKLYVADSGAHKVWEVDVTNYSMTAIAGSGQPGLPEESMAPLLAPLKQPFDVAVDADNNVLIAGTGHDVIWVLCRTATASYGLNMAADGLYLIAGRIGMSGSTVTDNVPAREEMLNKPYGIELDAFGNLLIASTDQHRVRIVDRQSGVIRTLVGLNAGSADGLGVSYQQGTNFGDARVNGPRDLVRDADGTLYIADALNHAVRRVRQDGLR